jgi:hypothetical protein
MPPGPLFSQQTYGPNLPPNHTASQHAISANSSGETFGLAYSATFCPIVVRRDRQDAVRVPGAERNVPAEDVACIPATADRSRGGARGASGCLASAADERHRAPLLAADDAALRFLAVVVDQAHVADQDGLAARAPGGGAPLRPRRRTRPRPCRDPCPIPERLPSSTGGRTRRRTTRSSTSALPFSSRSGARRDPCPGGSTTAGAGRGRASLA